MDQKNNHQHHKEGEHLLILEDGKITYVAVPEKGKICFVDHQIGALGPEEEHCCREESEHVHAHVHHGDEVTEDILLEQCLEEACWTLPMLSTGLLSSVDEEHQHNDECGHEQIAHGDHFDFLVPRQDGSYLLVRDAGESKYEHGRLVKVGESLGKLKRRPRQLMNIFSYESPGSRVYERLPHEIHEIHEPPPRSHPPTPEQIVAIGIPENFQAITKTVLNVMGLCCPSEEPLVLKSLEPLPGVREVAVNFTTRTVTVTHDKLLTPEGRLVKALNDAKLDASLHRRGELQKSSKMPSYWTLVCGVLLGVSLFAHFYHPLKWVAIGAVAVGIPPIVMRAQASLRRRVLDINILIIIAVGGSIALADYVESASLVFLFTIAKWLEALSGEKTRSALASSMDVPKNAVLAETGAMVPVEEVKVGTLIAVKAGEMVPVDGIISSGNCSLDESSLTGEARPVEKVSGDEVWAGTVNLAGYVVVQATKPAESSAVSMMMKLVEEAQSKRSKTEQLVERFAKYYTPLLVVAALCLALIPLAARVHNEKHWIYLALVLLVVACPCALVLSTPVAIACGIQHAAKLGVVIRGGSYLETLAKIKCLAMDKTGTLTEGLFRVSEFLPVHETDNLQQILYWVTSVESRSSHPMAAALVSHASLNGVEPSKMVSDFQIIEGEGVSAVVDERLVEIGNARLASRLGWSSSAIERLKNRGATLGWVGVDHQLLAVFSCEDRVREEAPEALKKLKKLNVRVDMLTGDNAETANNVQSQLGEMVVHSGLLPQDKVRIVQELKEQGPTGMLGDGINDAPALAAADVGFAMGLAGSAAAVETADVFLMTDDLRKLPATIKLGRRVRSKILQNVVVSVLLKLGVLIASFTGHGYLWMAVLVDVGSCLLVTFNSTLLLKKSNQEKKSSGHHHHHGKACKDHNHGDEAHNHHHHEHDQKPGKHKHDHHHNHSHNHQHNHDHNHDQEHQHRDNLCFHGLHCKKKSCSRKAPAEEV